MRRRLARESALQMLYLMDCSKISLEACLRAVLENSVDLDETGKAFAKELLEGVRQNRSTIDSIIRKHSENWEFHRIAMVDRNILRLASFELLHQLQTPVNVAIDEALEIAKKYSSQDSSRFINGLLDKIKDYRPCDPPPKTP
ncbi:MAG: transcription antitermination factor NusB [Elusimicrobia bacterium]|nr:transcription antitermination factor NusB [Elusimicrobiota bacterium]